MITKGNKGIRSLYTLHVCLLLKSACLTILNSQVVGKLMNYIEITLSGEKKHTRNECLGKTLLFERNYSLKSEYS